MVDMPLKPNQAKSILNDNPQKFAYLYSNSSSTERGLNV